MKGSSCLRTGVLGLLEAGSEVEAALAPPSCVLVGTVIIMKLFAVAAFTLELVDDIARGMMLAWNKWIQMKSKSSVVYGVE